MVPKRDFLTVSDLSRDELTLRDLLQPCRVLADLLTLHEALGGWEGKIVARVGDGNNVANAWIEAAGVLGFELRVACPEGYAPDRAPFEKNQKLTRLRITEEPEDAVAGADLVTTDVWTSTRDIWSPSG